MEPTPGLTGVVEYVPGEYIAVMKKASVAEAHEAVASRFGGKKMAIGSRFRAVHLSAGEADLKELLAHPEVDYVERNQIARAIEAPAANLTRRIRCPSVQNEPLSWGQKRVTSESAADVADAFAHDPKWGNGVNVYVLDTGVRITHEEFEGRAVWGANFAGGADTDNNGHGTHCAGTIGGKTYGVAKGAKIVGVKVLSDSGSGSYGGIIGGIEWVAKQGKGVANMSLGGGYSAALNDAVNAATAEGVIFSNAAGNSNRDSCTFSPASAEDGVCVGSTELASKNGAQVDSRSSFSNYGACNTIFAPGSSIVAAYMGSDSAYATLSGTSMAAPHVAGVLAIGLQANPRYSPAQLKQWVIDTSVSDQVENPGSQTPNRLLHVQC
jgi:subtilisin family serine protease